MDAALHRIEALPGDGRYAVTFRRGDGSEQTAVVHVTGTDNGTDTGTGTDTRASVAEASLPSGWTSRTEAFVATVDALVAFERSRRASAPPDGVLRDLEGGWDVSLGNVVAGEGGRPSCIAHGPMEPDGATWRCAECGAAALLG